MTGTCSYVACFAEDDWEFGHRKLAGLPVEDEASERAQFDEWLKKKGLGSTGDSPEAKFVGRNIEEDFEDELDREEVSLHFWLSGNTARCLYTHEQLAFCFAYFRSYM